MQDLLIVGGYGVVGRRIAEALAPDYPERVVLAGRNRARADATAAHIGHGTCGRVIDINDAQSIAAALEGVSTVISCIDQPGRKLLWAAARRGLGYTDITPHLTELGRGAAYDEIDAAARTSGARLVLGTGIVPGISNVVVRALSDALGGAEEIETALLLTASDISGPASFDYFLQELTMRFDIRLDGVDYPTRAFSDPRRIEFPAPVGPRLAYLFPFSDQVLYPRTLGARTVLTRLAIEPQWMASLLALLARSGLATIAAHESIRHAIAQRRKDRPSGEGAPFALRVDVRRNGRARCATLLGRTQADAAAAGASEIGRLLIDGAVGVPGALMPEQIADPAPFLARLSRRGLHVAFPDAGSDALTDINVGRRAAA